MITSGIRIGTPAITTRGLLSEDMTPLAEAICLALKNDDTLLPRAKDLVVSLCKKYPLYGEALHKYGYMRPSS